MHKSRVITSKAKPWERHVENSFLSLPCKHSLAHIYPQCPGLRSQALVFPTPEHYQNHSKEGYFNTKYRKDISMSQLNINKKRRETTFQVTNLVFNARLYSCARYKLKNCPIFSPQNPQGNAHFLCQALPKGVHAKFLLVIFYIQDSFPLQSLAELIWRRISLEKTWWHVQGKNLTRKFIPYASLIVRVDAINQQAVAKVEQINIRSNTSRIAHDSNTGT